MSSIVTHEGELVPLPESLDRHRIVDQLLRYSACADFPCFRLKRGSLYAAEVVGTIQIGKVRISILPKSKRGSESGDSEFLLNLLQVAGFLGTRPSKHMATVRSTSLDPLEALLLEVSQEMLHAARVAIPRRYEALAGDSDAIRGRIDFQRLARKVPGKDFTMPIRHTPLCATNVLSRTLKWVAQSILRMARSPSTRVVVEELLSMFEGVADRAPTRNEIQALVLTRYEAAWTRTIGIAKLLVDKKFIDPTFAGREDAFGMLFPLQHLYERALRHILHSAVQPLGLKVEHRSLPHHMLHDDGDTPHLRLKPDYVFLLHGAPVMVGDAKWKRLLPNERAYGVDRADIYQINAYLTRYGIAQATLFVPQLAWMKSGWSQRYSVPTTSYQMYLLAVDIESLVSRVSLVRIAALSALSAALANVTASSTATPAT